jgi:hypothetical protein
MLSIQAASAATSYVGIGNGVTLSVVGVTLRSNFALSWDNGSSATDLSIWRDAANTLALRNGTNAQAFNIYNTYTDASNYERGAIKWATNVFQIGPEKAGTGTQRVMSLRYLEDGGAGSTTPSLGTTCPAASATVKSWIKIVTSDGTTAYIPCWA